MDTHDLSRLSIDRGAQPRHGGRTARRRALWIGLAVALAIAAALAGWRLLAGRLTVETATVTLAYPAQELTLLNATGYVAPQRKASISSKATGRLEWLGVLEGSRVKKDELIARLENRDVAAALGQAQANVGVARANLVQANAELADAASAYRRSSELEAQNFISPAANDAARARYNRRARPSPACRRRFARPRPTRARPAWRSTRP